MKLDKQRDGRGEGWDGIEQKQATGTMAFLNLGGGVEDVAADRGCLGLFRTSTVVGQILKRS